MTFILDLITKIINFFGSTAEQFTEAIHNSVCLAFRNFHGGIEHWDSINPILIFTSAILFFVCLRFSKIAISNPVLQIRAIKVIGALALLPTAGYLLINLIIWPLNFSVAYLHSEGYRFLEVYEVIFKRNIEGLFLGSTIGVVHWFLIGKYLEPLFARKYSLAKDKDGLSDIRTLTQEKFPVIDYKKAILDCNKKNEVFLGVRSDGTKVTIPFDNFKSKNIQVAGEPGAGKGVVAQGIFGQIYNAVCSIIFDPKCDPYLTSFFAQKGKTYFIDLRNNNPQIDLFKDSTKTEIADSLKEAFRLREKGAESDVYTIEEAEYIEQIVDAVPNFTTKAFAVTASEQFSDARKITPLLRQIARLGALIGNKSLLEIMKTNKAVYIIFDESSEIQKLIARLIYSKINQIKKNKQIKRHITILADEFFHLISKTTVDSLGLMRSRGINAIICHQSLGDFIGQFGDVESKAAKQRTLDNTHIKIIYRQQQDAKFWSSQTGSKTYKDTSIEAFKNDAGGDIQSSDGRISTKQRPLIDENEFLSLGKGIAVIIGLGVAQKIKMIPPQVELCDFKIKPCPRKKNNQKGNKNAA
ncbi:MAG: type IV secretory system conjugative DNA transfer family protein [Gammaproteobacteria bacterium]|nr:MAG: type IV secretory system conjugative DNA transfer family protein [Gammaproteobacteria bacterium]